MAKLNVPRPLCIADGCLRDFDKRSLCGKHYKFYREHGIELPPPLFRKHYCCIEDCDKDAYGHGYCHLHYKRLQSTGDPNLAQRNRGIGYTAVQRFWSRVALTANDEKCWLWTGSVNENGYGEVTADGYKTLTHRYARYLATGTKPVLHVLHHCDTPRCVNPKHLYEGTDQDNADDKVRRGRQNKGSQNGSSKYSE